MGDEDRRHFDVATLVKDHKRASKGRPPRKDTVKVRLCMTACARRERERQRDRETERQRADQTHV